MQKLPTDPVMLLSVVNTKLRDYYPSLETLCIDMEVEKDTLVNKLGSIDYTYDETTNQFL